LDIADAKQTQKDANKDLIAAMKTGTRTKYNVPAIERITQMKHIRIQSEIKKPFRMRTQPRKPQ